MVNRTGKMIFYIRCTLRPIRGLGFQYIDRTRIRIRREGGSEEFCKRNWRRRRRRRQFRSHSVLLLLFNKSFFFVEHFLSRCFSLLQITGWIRAGIIEALCHCWPHCWLHHCPFCYCSRPLFSGRYFRPNSAIPRNVVFAPGDSGAFTGVLLLDLSYLPLLSGFHPAFLGSSGVSMARLPIGWSSTSFPTRTER